MRYSFLAIVLALPLFTACSDESVDPVPFDPTSLAPPPAGEGVQFATDQTIVPAGNEYQDCYFYKVSDLAKAGGLDPSQPVRLHRVQIGQKEGSHHFNIFRVRTIVGLDPANGAFQHAENGMGECYKGPNWADWPLIANSQAEGGLLDWEFPEGVVNELEPDEWLMAQTHYVNASTQDTPDFGKVVTNFWVLPENEVQHQMGTLFATKQSIRVCQSNPQPAFDGTCHVGNVSEQVHIIGANGHFHARGRQFDIFAWDGTSTTTPPDSARFYQSTEWDDPPMIHSPELDLVLPQNGGIWYTCGFQWQMPPSGCDKVNAADKEMANDCCYTFGGQVEFQEHCNAFVYYYPKLEGEGDVACF